MRTHQQIIRAIGHADLSELTDASIHTVRSWDQRDSLPAKHWKAVVDAGHAEFEELASGAAAQGRAA